MMSKKKILLTIVSFLGLVLLTGFIVSYYALRSVDTALSDPPPNEYIIPFEDVGENIYIRARGWGLIGGNHQEIIISTLPIFGFDEDNDRQIVYLDNTEIYIKKVGRDTLEIHAGILTEIPIGFSPNVKIIQIRLDPFKTASYAAHYKDYGFTRVSIYPAGEPNSIR